MARTIISRLIPKFPSNVFGAAGIDVTKSNGAFTISTDFDQFSSTPGSMLIRNGVSWRGLLPGAENQILQIIGGIPTWDFSGSDVTINGDPPITVVSGSGIYTIGIDLDFYIDSQGGLLKRGATAWSGLTRGSQYQVLQADANDLTYGFITDQNISATLTAPEQAEFRNRIGAAASVGAIESALFQHVETPGTPGGSSSTGVYQNRLLNSTSFNTIPGASLGNNRVTLPAGTYYFRGQGAAYQCGRTRTKLRNFTDSTDIIIGPSSASGGSAATTTYATVQGILELADTKEVQLQQYTALAVATNGLGLESSSGDTEIYAELYIEKRA